MKKTAPLSKVVYDGKIHLINNALGLHSYVSRVHGNKLKAKMKSVLPMCLNKLLNRYCACW